MWARLKLRIDHSGVRLLDLKACRSRATQGELMVTLDDALRDPQLRRHCANARSKGERELALLTGHALEALALESDDSVRRFVTAVRRESRLSIDEWGTFLDTLLSSAGSRLRDQIQGWAQNRVLH